MILMMNIAPFIAILFYLAATVSLARKFYHAGEADRLAGRWFNPLAFAALILHARLLYPSIFPGEGLDFGFFNALSLIGWLVALIVTLTAFFRPLENLLLLLFPLAILAILLEFWMPGERILAASLAGGLRLHILLSICAYSLLMISALQALILAWQEKMLKARRTSRILPVLPPLQVMENLLIELIIIGFFLLSLSLVTGLVFIEDLFAQHLVHKTVLSVVAWLSYCVLLWKRWTAGWRGKKISRWALGGFVALLLAYLGSKFVLELVLQRV